MEGMRYVHKIAKYKDVTIQMDTTYWGRDFGLMVIRDALRGKVLWHKYVHHGTIAQYAEGVDWLKRNGFRILSGHRRNEGIGAVLEACMGSDVSVSSR